MKALPKRKGNSGKSTPLNMLTAQASMKALPKRKGNAGGYSASSAKFRRPQ